MGRAHASEHNMIIGNASDSVPKFAAKARNKRDRRSMKRSFPDGNHPVGEAGKSTSFLAACRIAKSYRRHCAIEVQCSFILPRITYTLVADKKIGHRQVRFRIWPLH